MNKYLKCDHKDRIRLDLVSGNPNWCLSLGEDGGTRITDSKLWGWGRTVHSIAVSRERLSKLIEGKEKVTFQFVDWGSKGVYLDGVRSKTEYKSMKEPVCIICPEHGEFWQLAHTHLTNHGCPKCSSSRLEIIIKDILEQNNIHYIHQCKFDWLKDINHLTVDFYLPEYNVVIECQGLQHFRPCDFGSKKRDKNKLYESILKHDKIKFEECKKT